MSLMGMLAGAGSIAVGQEIANDIRQTGQDAATQMGDLAGVLKNDTAFTGYGTTTGLGTTTVGSDGSTDLGVGPNTAMQTRADNVMGVGAHNIGAASNMMGGAFNNVAGREQEIYNRAMAMQQPGLDAQRAQQQAREAGMGRSGVMGSQFGGTGEDAAMARAQMQAQNQAAFQSMGQAQQEAMNQVQAGQAMGQLGQSALGMGNQMYQNSFTPMQMQMQAAQIGGQNADRFQSGQFTGANLGAQLGLGAIQTQVNAENVAADMWSNLAGAGLNSLSNMSGGLFGNHQGDGNWWQAGLEGIIGLDIF